MSKSILCCGPEKNGHQKLSTSRAVYVSKADDNKNCEVGDFKNPDIEDGKFIWNGSFVLENYAAKFRASWVFKNKDAYDSYAGVKTLDDSRKLVMKEFPSRFQRPLIICGTRWDSSTVVGGKKAGDRAKWVLENSHFTDVKTLEDAQLVVMREFASSFVRQAFVGANSIHDSLNFLYDATIQLVKAMARCKSFDEEFKTANRKVKASEIALEKAEEYLEQNKGSVKDHDLVDEDNDIIKKMSYNSAAALALAAARVRLSEASDASAAAAASNWIPYWGCGPVEVATAACAVEVASAKAAVNAAVTSTRIASKALEVAVSTKSETVSKQRKGEKYISDGFQKVTMARCAVQIVREVAEHCGKELEDAKIFAERCLKAYCVVLTSEFDVEDMTNMIQQLSKNNVYWKALEGLDHIMKEYPHDGKFEPKLPEENKECDESTNDLTNGFFSGLEENVSYAFIGVFSGIKPRNPDDPTICTTMTALPSEMLTFFLEIYQICASFEAHCMVKDLLPKCLDSSVMNYDQVAVPHTELPSFAAVRLRGLLGKTGKTKITGGMLFGEAVNFMANKLGAQGFFSASGVRILDGVPIYNVDGSSHDVRGKKDPRGKSWIGWYGVEMMAQMKGKKYEPLFPDGENSGKNCCIATSTPPLMNHTTTKGLLGGHMNIHDKDFWAILPICCGHNNKKYDEPDCMRTLNKDANGQDVYGLLITKV